MEAIVEQCCGLDVHQDTVVAWLLVGRPHERPRKEMRTFRTVTRELVRLREWLEGAGCTTWPWRAPGSTGGRSTRSWRGPANSSSATPGTSQAVPGRKTDVKDSEWLADLCRHGRIAPSLVPPQPIRELRDLVGYRRKLVDARSATAS